MTKLKEHELVVLTIAVPSEGLVAGDVGTVAHIYADGEAFEVEFIALDGHTTAVITLEAGQLRAVTPRDMIHTREIQAV